MRAWYKKALYILDKLGMPCRSFDKKGGLHGSI